MLHRGEVRGLMTYYRQTLATYQQLVAAIRAHMLCIVRAVMDMMSEKEREELLNQKDQEGVCFF